MTERTKGDTAAFDQNWRTRKETKYNHWTLGVPNNQIQLAFRCHWEVFNQLLGELAQKKGAVLEVGCGRGSLSSYFASTGWDCTLLDYSPSVLAMAQEVFSQNGHSAKFVPGDANDLPFPAETFDVTFSIGLLEHFEDVRQVISEQLRVLKPGGWFLGYIVPERPDNLQRYFNWINWTLRQVASIFNAGKKNQTTKQEVFRSDLSSEHYIAAIEGLKYSDMTVFGMYSMPMISHSPEFPFTLLPKPLEWILTRIFSLAIKIRGIITGRHGWICDENMGQAFLLAFRKPDA